MFKIKINKIVDPKEGEAYTLAKEGAWQFLSSGKLIFYQTFNDDDQTVMEEIEKGKTQIVEEDIDVEILKDIQKNRRQAEIEFEQNSQIRPGVFSLKDSSLQVIAFPEELYYDTQVSKQLKVEIQSFFNKTELLKKFKKTKRSYLLHSIPGVGKTALIRQICREYSDDSTAIIRISGEVDYNMLHYIFSQEYNPSVKRIILTIEDIGGKTQTEMNTSISPQCLNFLDGDNYLFRVPTLIICTTNFIRALGTTLINRPGRFSKIIKVVPPKDEEVFEIVKLYSGLELTSDQKNTLAGKGLTPDYCVEAVVRSNIEEISLEKAVEQILLERQGYVDTKDWQ